MYDQKDVVQIPFPYSDLTGFKKRPALIISNNKVNKPDKICCLITSKFHKEDSEIEKIFIKKGNLPFKSFARPHRLFTIHEKIIIKKLCTINDKFHNKIIEKINEFLEIKKNSQ